MSANPMTRYTVQTLRSGQPRAYADTEREYLITIERERYGKEEGFFPWLMYGDVEAQIKKEERMRAEGTMAGGYSPEQLRAAQRKWAIDLTKTLCHGFREKSDDDGKTGMDAHFYPTLRSLKIDPVNGIIRIFIIEPYTD